MENALWELNQEADSYLILEQKDPQAPETCWFIQCAVARQGPDKGSYAVEIGCAAPEGSRLWTQVVPDMQAAIDYFYDAYDSGSLDVSGFRETVL